MLANPQAPSAMTRMPTPWSVESLSPSGAPFLVLISWVRLMTARASAKLVDYMKAHGYTHAYPHLGGRPPAEKKTWDLQAGYVQRSLNQLPKSSTKRPWVVRQDYLADAIDFRFRDKIEEDMVFGTAKKQARLVG